MSTLFVCLYFGILITLACHGLHIPWLIYQRLRYPPQADPEPACVNDPDLPRVTVQLPLFNEKVVAPRLLEAVSRLDYPNDRLEIQVLDDSTDETTQVVARMVNDLKMRGFTIDHLHRNDRIGYKAGALREGLLKARGEFIAVFDADFVPQTDFLLRIIPCFKEERVGMVQARWGHLNSEDSFLTRLQALFLDGHFIMESQTRDAAGLFLNFNGTAGVWRRECIEDAGGWQPDTLTEDLDLSYRAQLRGWRFRFLKDCVAPAELPRSMNAFKSQQARWTCGAVQTLRKLGWSLAQSSVPMRIRLEAFFHLTSHLVFPLLVLLALSAYPALNLRLADSTWRLLLVDLPLYGLGIFSVNIFYLWGQWVLYPKDRLRFLKIPGLLFLGTGLAVSNSIAVWQGYQGSVTPFIRTPKSGNQLVGPYRPPKSQTPLIELGLALYLFFCVIHALYHGHPGSIPFLLVFAIGFGGMGLLSWWERGLSD